MSHKCPVRVTHKSVLQECPARVSLKSVPQDFPTRVTHKSVLQECPSVPQEFPTRVTHKSVIRAYVAVRTCLRSGSWAPSFLFEVGEAASLSPVLVL